MSISAVTSQPPQFVKPQSSGSAKEASEPKSSEVKEAPAKESSEGGSKTQASPPPGTAKFLDIRA